MSDNPAWEQRFVAGRLSLPASARHDPDRGAYLGGTGGWPQVYVLDEDRPRRLTDAVGVSRVAISPDGEQVWWFNRAVTGGPGRWMITPFHGGPTVQALASQPGPQPLGGLAFADDGTAALGVRDGGRSQVYLIAADGQADLLLDSEDDLFVGGLSADGALLCLTRPVAGNPRRPEIAVYQTSDGSVAAMLALPGGAHPAGFCPGRDDHRLLVLHEPTGRAMPLIYDVATGTQAPVDLGLVGETRAEWYPDGRHLLVCHIYQARSTLLRHDLASGASVPIGPAQGFVRDATTRADGSVDLIWSSPADPPGCYRISPAGRQRLLLRRPNEPPTPLALTSDVWAPGQAGPVHALISTPKVVDGRPSPAIFVLHGGPSACDTDSFGPYVAAWVDHGYTVVRVNYRGSTGYGTAWRTGLDGAGGLPALDDMAAVRQHLIETGVIDPAKIAIAGASYGGYLVLLAIGRHPDDYAVAIAEAPIADCVAAYTAEPERLRALDRVLFGGTPDERPEVWSAGNPITFVGRVRTPVLIIAGIEDPRCPFEQVQRYVEALAQRGASHRLISYPGGHGTPGGPERIRQVREQLAFVTAHLPTGG
jgi:dipeptidyl aminopeptidase/acylaminoacyl peptidase